MSKCTVQKSKRSINLNFDTEYLDKDLEQKFKEHLKGTHRSRQSIVSAANELTFYSHYINYLKHYCYSEEFYHSFPYSTTLATFCQLSNTKFIHNIFEISVQVEIKGNPGLRKKIFKESPKPSVFQKQLQTPPVQEIAIHNHKSGFYNLYNLQKIFPLGMEISFDKQFINYGDKRIYIKEISYFVNGDQYKLNNWDKYKIIINSYTTVIDQNSEYLEIGFTDAILDIPPNILQNIKNDHEYYTGVVIKFENYTTQLYVENYINMIDISKYVTGSAQPKLNQQNLNTVQIALPNIEEQTFIVNQIQEERKIVEGNKKLIEIYSKKIADRINKIWGK